MEKEDRKRKGKSSNGERHAASQEVGERNSLTKKRNEEEIQIIEKRKNDIENIIPSEREKDERRREKERNKNRRQSYGE